MNKLKKLVKMNRISCGFSDKPLNVYHHPKNKGPFPHNHCTILPKGCQQMLVLFTGHQLLKPITDVPVYSAIAGALGGRTHKKPPSAL